MFCREILLLSALYREEKAAFFLQVKQLPHPCFVLNPCFDVLVYGVRDGSLVTTNVIGVLQGTSTLHGHRQIAEAEGRPFGSGERFALSLKP